MDVNFTNAGRNSLCSGLSLIELIIALSIGAILLGLAAPSFSQFIKNSRMTGYVNAMVATLYHARSEAAKRNRNVLVCKSSDGQYCDRATTWDQGWIAFADLDDSRTRSADEPLVSVHQALESGDSLRLGAFPTSNYLIFYPSGTQHSNGTFTFCDERGPEHAKAVIFWKSGRARSSRLSARGEPLDCP